jgi:hypothetical protein
LTAGYLMATGFYQYVEPDWIVYPIECPDDPEFGNQWHHQDNRMQSCDGWDIHTGEPYVGVGICDTGVLTSHEDLQLHRLEGYNAVDRVWEFSGGDAAAHLRLPTSRHTQRAVTGRFSFSSPTSQRADRSPHGHGTSVTAGRASSRIPHTHTRTPVISTSP